MTCGDIAAMDGATKFTLSAWLKRDSAGNAVTIAKGPDTTHRFGPNFWTDGEVYLNLCDGGGTDGNFTSNDTNWHHIAVTRDSSNNLRLFLDGTLNVTRDILLSQIKKKGLSMLAPGGIGHQSTDFAIGEEVKNGYI